MRVEAFGDDAVCGLAHRRFLEPVEIDQSNLGIGLADIDNSQQPAWRSLPYERRSVSGTATGSLSALVSMISAICAHHLCMMGWDGSSAMVMVVACARARRKADRSPRPDGWNSRRRRPPSAGRPAPARWHRAAPCIRRPCPAFRRMRNAYFSISILNVRDAGARAVQRMGSAITEISSRPMKIDMTMPGTLSRPKPKVTMPMMKSCQHDAGDGAGAAENIDAAEHHHRYHFQLDNRARSMGALSRGAKSGRSRQCPAINPVKRKRMNLMRRNADAGRTTPPSGCCRWRRPPGRNWSCAGATP